MITVPLCWRTSNNLISKSIEAEGSNRRSLCDWTGSYLPLVEVLSKTAGMIFSNFKQKCYFLLLAFMFLKPMYPLWPCGQASTLTLCLDILLEILTKLVLFLVVRSRDTISMIPTHRSSILNSIHRTATHLGSLKDRCQSHRKPKFFWGLQRVFGSTRTPIVPQKLKVFKMADKVGR